MFSDQSDNRSDIEDKISKLAEDVARLGDTELLLVVPSRGQWNNLSVFKALSNLAERSDDVGERARSLVAEFGAVFLGVGT